MGIIVVVVVIVGVGIGVVVIVGVGIGISSSSSSMLEWHSSIRRKSNIDSNSNKVEEVGWPANNDALNLYFKLALLASSIECVPRTAVLESCYLRIVLLLLDFFFGLALPHVLDLCST